MATVKELFFYVSGEHETLPYAEIKAILEADNFSCRNTIFLPHTFRTTSALSCPPQSRKFRSTTIRCYCLRVFPTCCYGNSQPSCRVFRSTMYPAYRVPWMSEKIRIRSIATFPHRTATLLSMFPPIPFRRNLFLQR